jgi:hypothetical protein
MPVAMFVLGFLLMTQPAGAQTNIYRCLGEAGTVYSDRPCSQSADRHEIDDSRVSVYTPTPADKPATTVSAKTMKAKPPSKARLPDPAKHRLTCGRIEQSLRDIRNKMRSGYGVEEGERLKTRQRQLDQRRRLENCS